jgi:hypothetical protein
VTLGAPPAVGITRKGGYRRAGAVLALQHRVRRGCAGDEHVEGLDTALIVAMASSLVVWVLVSARLSALDVSAPTAPLR